MYGSGRRVSLEDRKKEPGVSKGRAEDQEPLLVRFSWGKASITQTQRERKKDREIERERENTKEYICKP